MNNKELNNAYKKINSWYSKKVKVLNIKTRPFNTALVFSNIIKRVLREKGSVLYVFCQSDISNINKKQQEYSTLLIEEDSDRDFYNIRFVSIEKVADIHEEFDLVIFDDITVFSDITMDKLREAIEEVYWRVDKIIIYTFEKAFPIGEKIDLVYLISNNPVIEPRFITTRIKLEEDIPLTLYDYLKWFNENKKVTLIITPTEEKLNKVYNHYYNTLRVEKIRVIKYIKSQSFSFIKDILDGYKDGIFIVTNNIGDYITNIDNVNIIVLFADENNYSYKRFVYLCAALNKKDNIIPEAILVSKEITSNMDKSKSITRGFNQKLWEKKLLKV